MKTDAPSYHSYRFPPEIISHTVWLYLIFRPVLEIKGGPIKGNVDAELVLHTMIQYPNYDKAVIVTGDGDFTCLVEYLYGRNKLKRVLSPSIKKCSRLLKKQAREKIDFLENWRGKLEHGTVKLRLRLANWADEKRHTELPWISISDRNHQPRRLAVSPFLLELSGRRRSAFAARHHGLV